MLTVAIVDVVTDGETVAVRNDGYVLEELSRQVVATCVVIRSS